MDKSMSRRSIASDLSSHNLNNSSSKQKFSFPKASRFEQSRFGYLFFYQDVIRFIKYQPQSQAELLLLAMAARIWEYASIEIFHNPHPIIFKVSFCINAKKVSLLGLADKYMI